METVCCSKCQSNRRIVVYRRAPLVYLCEMCAESPQRRMLPLAVLKRLAVQDDLVDAIVRARAPRSDFGHGPLGAFTRGQAEDALAAVANRGNPLKKGYQGFRLAHDPRRS